MKTIFRQELGFVFGAVTTALFYIFSSVLLSDLAPNLKSTALFLWVFGAMLWCAFGVVRHADGLAHLLGEPYGTLILTLSVISIEVSLIAAIMLAGENEPTLARDTMFAVLMIVLNGMVGLALLLGGFRHHEQHYNLHGAKAFLAIIIPLAVMTLVLPVFAGSPRLKAFTPTQEVFFAATTILLYGVFLSIQTVRHRSFFLQPGARIEPSLKDENAIPDEGDTHAAHEHVAIRSAPYHAALLILTMLPVVLLSKKLAVFVDFGIERIGAPAAFGGLVIAILVLAPEGLGAFRAALANQLQRSVNILLGSALATIGLTVPAVLTIGLTTSRTVELGLNNLEMVLLLLTLAVSTLTFTGGRTNILQGAVHLMLFLVYVVLIFNP
jgi:Ca2+:H+ antiporter